MVAVERVTDNRLCCVALPLLARDVGQNLANLFDLWDDPRFLPRVSTTGPLPNLLIVLNKGDSETMQRAEEMFRARPSMAACFAGIKVEDAGLEGDRDLYARDAAEAKGIYGNKAGPNFLFQRTMEFAAVYGGWTLQIEVDCLPVRAGWLEATQQVIEGGARSWVIGTIYGGNRGLDRSIQTHLNGNALYKTGDPAFQKFVAEVWIPSILKLVPELPNLAYDCWWSLQCFWADSYLGNEAWELFKTYGSFFRYDPFVVNLLVPADQSREFARLFLRFAAIDRVPVFFHGAAMNTVLPALLENRQDSILSAISRLDPSGNDLALADLVQAAPGQSEQSDIISQLSARLAGGDLAAANLLLVSCSTRLLIDPSKILARQEADTALASAIRLAMTAASQAARSCYRAALDHAQQTAT